MTSKCVECNQFYGDPRRLESARCTHPDNARKDMAGKSVAAKCVDVNPLENCKLFKSAKKEEPKKEAKGTGKKGK